MNGKNDLLEKIISLSKRKGFVYQSSEIYGGLNGCYDYGPLGSEMLRNIKDEWWRFMTYRDDVEGVDASILMSPEVWVASGHVENFTDPMIDCKNCKSRFRVDYLVDQIAVKKKTKILEALLSSVEDEGIKKAIDANLKKIAEKPDEVNDFITELFDSGEAAKLIAALNCPVCGTPGSFTPARKFNLMFKTFLGSVEETGSAIFLRPETAQGIFVNFGNVQGASRQKIPFGIAQIGKAFRNEINTRYFLFRTREFEQMEMQYFVKPSDDKKYYDYWKEERMNWFTKLGMKSENLRYHDHPANKLAHYAKEATDIEYKFPFGWGEIEGIHNRTDFDLGRHEQYSKKGLKYFDEETKEKYLPYIIETSAGASRSFLAFLVDAYDEEDLGGDTRTVLHLHPRLAPVKAAILPLVNKDGMPEFAKKIEDELRPKFKIFYDDKAAIGRRYRRMDEIGTPYAITVDTQTLEDNTVTVRERDSMEQIRVDASKLTGYLTEKLS
ncbi:MAG: glycine--tRNA ligase [Ignavibacteriales bacterium]|nr:MAG: glycine--tRNA ligase [Ignavibacteriaceae bacterium]MBW7872517.1 glycine--tRNA ligase [Ignavibacteria bacterium]MCZ2141930.1 glycine--tRNA ligase [Ignavibacteriales bacterium]OQY73696.1 MAG: glycine--tRNA ligase [Ignavibacteriales bacterium UTCHB3]MBV6445096.1 Glycine--tRNA ligase [Ignavibacteriaceae bacterium]